MNIQIGPLAFDHADYDQDGDVLYLHVGLPQTGEGEEPLRGTCSGSPLGATASSG